MRIDLFVLQAPDIPNIPPASTADGLNYLIFLITLRVLLPGKSISIAAPASYWYLKGFRIAEISKVVDYIVYMTYDLHGQVSFLSICSLSASIVSLTLLYSGMQIINGHNLAARQVTVFAATLTSQRQSTLSPWYAFVPPCPLSAYPISLVVMSTNHVL
jgi:hypothetical protein